MVSSQVELALRKTNGDADGAMNWLLDPAGMAQQEREYRQQARADQQARRISALNVAPVTEGFSNLVTEPLLVNAGRDFYVRIDDAVSCQPSRLGRVVLCRVLLRFGQNFFYRSSEGDRLFISCPNFSTAGMADFRTGRLVFVAGCRLED